MELQDRQIRVFISSTFRDMHVERDYLVKYTFPELRRLCESRGVTWGEVDLRWGVTTEQAAEGKVLPICLEEIRRCRPYFIGLLGERYGWIPDSIPGELIEREPWLAEQHRGRTSVTEMEILHGVLRDPSMAGHAFFYFRSPEFVKRLSAGEKADFISENPECAGKLKALKDRIRASGFPVREDFPDAKTLGAHVLADLKSVIETRFPEGCQPSPLDREAMDHEAYAASRRRVYIGRDGYYQRLDQHAAGDTRQPLVVLGESGSGKSALLANWVARWREAHPQDLVLQHYIGASPHSAEWQPMLRRLMEEFKRHCGITEDIPTKPDDLRAAFPVWLYTAAARRRVVLVLDALNQIEDADRAPDLPWLPQETPPGLRLIVSMLPGRPLDECRRRQWPAMQVEPLDGAERRRLIVEYLKDQGRALDRDRADRIANAPQCANPLFLRILLEELRVFGLHEKLGAQIDHLLASPTIEDLCEKVIIRWEDDYEGDTDLVGDVLSALWAARRGLSEAELLDYLGNEKGPLPRAVWSPLYLAMSGYLITRSGLLTFAHDYIRTAARDAYIPSDDGQKRARLRLADYFERQVDMTARKADEWPWLLQEAHAWDRLQAALLDRQLFLTIQTKLEDTALGSYWVRLREVRPEVEMGKLYLEAFARWEVQAPSERALSGWANELAIFLNARACFAEAEPPMRRALAILEKVLGKDHPNVAGALNNLAQLLMETSRLKEAEPLMRRGLAIDEASKGKDHPHVAIQLNNLADLLQATNRLVEAEPLMRRALAIDEASYGKDHPHVAIRLNNLARLLQATNRLADAEPLMRRGLAIEEASKGEDHPHVAIQLNSLAALLQATNRLAEAEPLMRRALAIYEKSYGPDHPHVATSLNNLAALLQDTNRLGEAEPLMRRALAIDEASYGKDHPKAAIRLNNLAHLLQATNRLAEAKPLHRRALAIWEKSYGPDHPHVASSLNNLARLLQATNRLAEAEPLYRWALAIYEKSYGSDHPLVATSLNNLALLLQDTNRLAEAEPLMRRALVIHIQCTHATGHPHPQLQAAIGNYVRMMRAMGKTEAEIRKQLAEMGIRIQNPNASPLDRSRELNEQALDYRKAGEYDKAEPLLREALAVEERERGADHPMIAHRRNNLASVLLLQHKHPEALDEFQRAWAIQSKNHDLISGRILFLRLALAMKTRTPMEPILGRLKSLLKIEPLTVFGNIAVTWEINYLIDRLAPAIGEDNTRLLRTLATVLNDRTKAVMLDDHPDWREAEPLPLDGPLPE